MCSPSLTAAHFTKRIRIYGSVIYSSASYVGSILLGPDHFRVTPTENLNTLSKFAGTIGIAQKGGRSNCQLIEIRSGTEPYRDIYAQGINACLEVRVRLLT